MGGYTVTMEDMYEYMKEALRHFDLHFFDKPHVNVSVSRGHIHFTYGTRSVSYALPEHFEN